MKKILLFTVLVTFISFQTKSQCTFGSFPPSYTVNPGWTNGAWLAQKYNLASSATLTGLGLNSAANSGISFRMALYTDASNTPGNVVSVSNQGTMALGPNVLSLSAYTVIPAGNYWIVAIYGGSGPTTYSPGGSPIMYQAGSLSTPPANNSAWTTSSNYLIDYWAVINSPTVTISGSTLACIGATVTLTAGGASSYTWSNGTISNSLGVSPTTNTVYTVVGTGTNGCPGIASKSLTSHVSPTVNISGINTICAGSSLSQTVTGATTYTWNTGANTTTVLLSPPTNTVYTVTGSDAVGCTGSATVAVTVNPLPILSITGNTSVCVGSSLTQTVTGATTYTWNTGANTNTLLLSPTGNTVSSVNGTNANGCIGSYSRAISVNALPVLAVTSSNTLICAGETASLTVSGVTSCTWNSGATGLSFTSSPTLTTTYTLSGTDQNGCNNTASFTQSVNTCTGIQESHSESVGITIFPNPGNGIFTLNTRLSAGILNVEIFNSVGVLVQTENVELNTGKIDLSNYPDGLYYVIIRSGQDQSVIKLIKE